MCHYNSWRLFGGSVTFTQIFKLELDKDWPLGGGASTMETQMRQAKHTAKEKGVVLVSVCQKIGHP